MGFTPLEIRRFLEQGENVRFQQLPGWIEDRRRLDHENGRVAEGDASQHASGNQCALQTPSVARPHVGIQPVTTVGAGAVVSCTILDHRAGECFDVPIGYLEGLFDA